MNAECGCSAYHTCNRIGCWRACARRRRRKRAHGRTRARIEAMTNRDIYIHTYTYICAYMYAGRPRKRERKRHVSLLSLSVSLLLALSVSLPPSLRPLSLSYVLSSPLLALLSPCFSRARAHVRARAPARTDVILSVPSALSHLPVPSTFNIFTYIFGFKFPHKCLPWLNLFVGQDLWHGPDADYNIAQAFH